MTDDDRTDLDAAGRASDGMFELLDATGEDVVAVRMDAGTPAGYRAFYDLLVEKTDEYGHVHVYEEAPNWSLSTYLSHAHGIVPDLRDGPEFDIHRYAAVGDSMWFELLYYQWAAVAPVWPVAPDEMRRYSMAERRRAIEWVETGGQPSTPPDADDSADR